MLPLTLGVLPIFLISLIDDIRPVGPRKKFLAHFVGASVAVALGVSLGPEIHLLGSAIRIGPLAVPLSILWIVGVTNAFNFIDGLDGLSAGLALISAVSMAAVFMIVGEPHMGGVVLVLAGALAGFLPYNAHPARMFLGDTGATAIGFSLAIFALKGGSTLTSGFAALLPVFMLGLPIADTFITMARRVVGRLEKRDTSVFEPDRNHIHHRLLALGVDHGSAVLILYCAGLVLAVAAFVSIFLNAREAGLFVVALLVAGFIGVHRLGYDEFAFIRRGTVLKVYEMPAVKRGMFIVFIDVFLAIVTTYLAYALKTDRWSLTEIRGPLFDLATTLAPITVLVFWWSDMYRGSWRVAGLYELTKVARAVTITTAIGAVVVSLVSHASYPVSLYVIYGVVSLALTASMRASYVVLETTCLRASHQGTPVLVYGAGDSGVMAVAELFRDQSSGLRPIGFIDDDLSKRGRTVSGLPVFGTLHQIDEVIRAHSAAAVLISSVKIPEDRVAKVADACSQAGVSVFRLNVQVEALHRPLPIPVRVPIEIVGAPGLPTIATLQLVVPPGADACPSCGERELRRSKARSTFERLRRAHTTKRIFRCHNCGWRGWATPCDMSSGDIGAEAGQIDLSDVDTTLPAAVGGGTSDT
jgi:UDP-GlcNAc:undecaprenyl-phosphate GlcNAc-1-phosphate transferase